MSVADAARAAGMHTPNTLYNWLNGHTAQLSACTLKALSKGLEVPVGQLLGISPAKEPRPGTVVVRARTGAGEWRDRFDMALDQQFEAPVVVEPHIRAADAFGVLVHGKGAEKLYPAGSILVVVPFERWEGNLVAGRRVLLQRIRSDPGKIEVTVRELEVRQAEAWLWNRTDDPAHAGAIKMPWPYTGKTWRDGAEKYALAGVVLQSLVFEG